MRPHDIEALVAVGRPALAPDASFAIFATSRPDLDADRYVGQLWRIDLPDGEPRRLTRGTADRSPALRPDGARVAFLRADAKDRTQVFVVDVQGGEPVQATDAPLGVGDFSWSPDGATLAYTARVAEDGRYGTVDGLGPHAEPARHITGIRWHANGLGYLADRPARLFVISAPDTGAEPVYTPAPRPGIDDDAPAIVAEAHQLTSGAESWSGTVFSADGTEILGVPETIESDVRDLRDRVLAVRVGDGAVRELLAREGGMSVNEVAVAPDGQIFLVGNLVGDSGRDFVAPGTALWHLERGVANALTDPETIDLGEPGSRLGFDGDAIFAQDRTRGRVRLIRVDRDGTVTEILAGDVEVTGHAEAGGTVLASVATPTSFGELVLVGQGEARTLTALGRASDDIVVPTEFSATARDGYPLHGWIATPQGEGPFPVVLQIHGGPYASYGIHLFDETQVLLDAGYAVVYSNPRGSAGYGRAHGRSIRGALGTVDYTDVMDFYDAALASDTHLDGARAGVMGGSYGGYMTAWIIAHDHRFAGAIVERGMLDPATFVGTSDIGSFFGDEYVGVDDDAIARQSPMAVVGEVRTPTFVIHSELDFRCPLEQATRYYSALKRQGTPAEMLIFPGEDHELTRAGRPRHRVQRFEAILDWWQRHIPQP